MAIQKGLRIKKKAERNRVAISKLQFAYRLIQTRLCFVLLIRLTNFSPPAPNTKCSVQPKQARYSIIYFRLQLIFSNQKKKTGKIIINIFDFLQSRSGFTRFFSPVLFYLDASHVTNISVETFILHNFGSITFQYILRVVFATFHFKTKSAGVLMY